MYNIKIKIKILKLIFFIKGLVSNLNKNILCVLTKKNAFFFLSKSEIKT